jgi:hypothetical protein
MADAEKCKNPPCTCKPEPGAKYCSASCAGTIPDGRVSAFLAPSRDRCGQVLGHIRIDCLKLLLLLLRVLHISKH